jgi:hypothetical protein
LGGVVWAVVVLAVVVLGGVAGEVVDHDVTVTPWVVDLTVGLVPDVGVAKNNNMRKFVEQKSQKLSKSFNRLSFLLFIITSGANSE